MSLYNKVKWILGILMVFLLIISTNLIDRTNFSRVKESVESIFEDRLVVKGYIIEMVKIVHQKELGIVQEDATFFEKENGQLNQSLAEYIQTFKQTRLTVKEENAFKNLERDFDMIKKQEVSFADGNFAQKTSYRKLLHQIKDELDQLSNIQLKEGNRQMAISKNAMDTMELFTQIEIYILVILAIAIQIIILYDPKKTK